MEDTKIIDLFWQRKETAIAEASEKYGDYCYAIAWNVLFNREDSEECVNDTWYGAWKEMPPKRPARLSAFLGKITRNFAVSRLRKRCAGRRMDTHMADLMEEAERLGAPLTCTVEEIMEEKELIHLLNRFLKSLSPEDRDIFVRRYWYMDSIKMIAERHRCSESRIKSNLFRNRKKLEKLLGGLR